jgi:predicted O-linked N-acetylglucosamine transferase (SPINDLY family)
LGSAIEQQKRADNALTIWQSMLDHPLVGPELNTDMYLMVVNSMGRLLEENRRYAAAEEKLYASLLTDPSQSKVIHHWVHLRQKQCKWPAFAEIPNLSHGDMLKAS